jgi:hypothetical protein
MSAYLQMGHDSENLVGTPGLEGFAGLILSPVNRSEGELRARVPRFRETGQLDIILDPQLYCPQSDRGQLLNHSYFPKDLDTADLASDGWWRQVTKKVAAEAAGLEADAVCSPIDLPKKYTPEYYTRCAEIYGMLASELSGGSVRPIMTVCVALKELANKNDALRIASIVTSPGPKSCYIVVEADVEPRRELTDGANLFALMVLVSALENSGCKALVSHCSSDMILMKAAGASDCASGKFFNLRRFTRSRFDEQQEGGGGQLPYWFEHNLLGFLREADIARLRQSGLSDFLGGGDSRNVFAEQILDQFTNAAGKPWVALSWRQYLGWFAGTEKRLSVPDAANVVSTWLREAEARWLRMEDQDVLLEESRNTGQWIRPWRQALSDFRRL